jgi:hypothetical protein
VSPGCWSDDHKFQIQNPLLLALSFSIPYHTNPASPTSLLPPTHTNKKIQNLLVLLFLFAVFLTLLVSTKPRCLSVRLSLLLPFNSKFKSKKNPGSLT